MVITIMGIIQSSDTEVLPGGPKKNAYKTKTFLLFGKIVKKLIITGISIINSIITQ